MVSFHVLFGDLCAQTKLEGVHPAATCGSLWAVSSSTDKDTRGSQFSDQISGLAFFWTFVCSSYNVNLWEALFQASQPSPRAVAGDTLHLHILSWKACGICEPTRSVPGLKHSTVSCVSLICFAVWSMMILEITNLNPAAPLQQFLGQANRGALTCQSWGCICFCCSQVTEAAWPCQPWQWCFQDLTTAQ